MSNVSPAGRIVPLRRPVCYVCILALLVAAPVVLCGGWWLVATILGAAI